MTDHTTDFGGFHAARDRRPGAERREFCAYFAVIFLATLPLALLTWALTAARRMELPERGPVARAWSQARVITPMIFSGA